MVRLRTLATLSLKPLPGKGRRSLRLVRGYTRMTLAAENAETRNTRRFFLAKQGVGNENERLG